MDKLGQLTYFFQCCLFFLELKLSVTSISAVALKNTRIICYIKILQHNAPLWLCLASFYSDNLAKTRNGPTKHYCALHNSVYWSLQLRNSIPTLKENWQIILDRNYHEDSQHINNLRNAQCKVYTTKCCESLKTDPCRFNTICHLKRLFRMHVCVLMDANDVFNFKFLNYELHFERLIVSSWFWRKKIIKVHKS